MTREGLSRSEKVIGIFRKDGWVGIASKRRDDGEGEESCRYGKESEKLWEGVGRERGASGKDG